MVSDPQMKIGRPRQLYTGPARQDYRTMESRSAV
jgi:citrate synthase